MSRRDRMGDADEIFEILVISYAQRGGALPAEAELCWRPATDAYETEDAFVVQMDLAGMDPGGIEVLADAHNLLVRGIRQDTSVPGKKHFHEMEISVGPFSRRVPLSVPVDPGSARAVYRNGFLYVTFQKGSDRPAGGRQIAIDR
ncbi:MAG: Hsp20/alpha crystallin family protein [Krumholzibacteria bacterium]|nr:Hsp20/alpha crystallin family protein [Candidatus Krumholzibacteria bacterium]